MKPCPNVYARKEGFDPRKAEQSGTRCNYRDPVHVELTCSGRGHVAKHHRQAEAESARSRSIGGSSAPRPTAVTHPVGTRSSRGPRPVGQQARPRARSAFESGRRPAAKPRPKHRIVRKTKPEHTRVADETEEEGNEDQDQVEDEEEDIEDLGAKQRMRSPTRYRVVSTLARSRRIWHMRAGSTPCRGVIWTSTRMLFTPVIHSGAPKGPGV